MQKEGENSGGTTEIFGEQPEWVELLVQHNFSQEIIEAFRLNDLTEPLDWKDLTDDDFAELGCFKLGSKKKFKRTFQRGEGVKVTPQDSEQRPNKDSIMNQIKEFIKKNQSGSKGAAFAKLLVEVKFDHTRFGHQRPLDFVKTIPGIRVEKKPHIELFLGAPASNIEDSDKKFDNAKAAAVVFEGVPFGFKGKDLFQALKALKLLCKVSDVETFNCTAVVTCSNSHAQNLLDNDKKLAKILWKGSGESKIKLMKKINKPCNYGDACTNPNCIFQHDNGFKRAGLRDKSKKFDKKKVEKNSEIMLHKIAKDMKPNELIEVIKALDIDCKFSNFQNLRNTTTFTCSFIHAKNFLAHKEEIAELLWQGRGDTQVTIRKMISKPCDHGDNCKHFDCIYYHENGFVRKGLQLQLMKMMEQDHKQSMKKKSTKPPRSQMAQILLHKVPSDYTGKQLAGAIKACDIQCKFSGFQSLRYSAIFSCSHAHAKNFLEKKESLEDLLWEGKGESKVIIKKVIPKPCIDGDNCGKFECHYFHANGFARAGIQVENMKWMAKDQEKESKKAVKKALRKPKSKLAQIIMNRIPPNFKPSELQKVLDSLEIDCSFTEFQSLRNTCIFSCSYEDAKNYLDHKELIAQMLWKGSGDCELTISKVNSKPCSFGEMCKNIDCSFYHESGLVRNGIQLMQMNYQNRKSKEMWKESMQMEQRQIKENTRRDQQMREMSKKQDDFENYQRRQNKAQWKKIDKNRRDNQENWDAIKEERKTRQLQSRRNRDLIYDLEGDLKKTNNRLKKNIVQTNILKSKVRNLESRLDDLSETLITSVCDLEQNIQDMRDSLRNEMGQKISFAKASMEQKQKVVEAQINRLESWSKSKFSNADAHRKEICSRLQVVEKAVARMMRLRHDCFDGESTIRIQEEKKVIDVKAKDLKEGMKVSTVDIQGNKIYQPITKVETKYSFSIIGLKLEGKDKKTVQIFLTEDHVVGIQGKNRISKAKDVSVGTKVICAEEIMEVVETSHAEPRWVVSVENESNALFVNDVLLGSGDDVIPIWMK